MQLRWFICWGVGSCVLIVAPLLAVESEPNGGQLPPRVVFLPSFTRVDSLVLPSRSLERKVGRMLRLSGVEINEAVCAAPGEYEVHLAVRAEAQPDYEQTTISWRILFATSDGGLHEIFRHTERRKLRPGLALPHVMRSLHIQAPKIGLGIADHWRGLLKTIEEEAVARAAREVVG